MNFNGNIIKKYFSNECKLLNSKTFDGFDDRNGRIESFQEQLCGTVKPLY